MTKHKPSDERQQQILDAAHACFVKKGFFATKIDDIAAEAGLSKGGIYFHFDSKQAIFHSLVQREYEEATQYIDKVAEADDDILTKLSLIGDHFIESFSTDSNTPRFMFIVGEMALRDADVRSMLVELQQNYIDRITNILEKAMALGQLRSVNPTSTAFMLKCLIDGAQASYAVGYQPNTAEILPDAMSILATGLMPQN